MTTFDKREEGFEQKFAHDEAMRFKATARRNRLFGLWAAEKLGLAGADAEAYAKSWCWRSLRKVITTCSRRCGAISTPRASSSPIIRSAARWMS